MDNTTPVRKPVDDFMNLSDLWRVCLMHWTWFVASIILFLSAASYYLMITPDMYTREASVLVKQEDQGKAATRKGSSNDDIQDLGMVMQVTNVANVQHELSSLDVLTEVVRRTQHVKDPAKVMAEAKSIKSRLKCEVADDKSTIINLKYTDYSAHQAEDVLYAIVQVYNEKWLQNKNQMTANTTQFVEARLRLLERDLGSVDDSISRYKVRNKITDLDRVSDIYLQQQSESESEILRITNQRAMVRYVLDILRSKSSRHQLLPTNSGINNQMAESQIIHYNSLLLQLRANMVGTSTQNPLIVQQETELDEIRKNILATLESQVNSLDIQINSLQGYNSEANSKITSNPSQAKHLVSVEREQKVKESLYLYLLQKKEENEVSMTYAAVNTKMIDMPNGSNNPTSPNSRGVLAAAFLAALLLPTVVLFVKESTDDRVRDKFDIERKTTLALIGDIPFNPQMQHKSLFSRTLHGHGKVTPLLVSPGKQDYINEAFRLIRSNLVFLTSRHGEKNVYIVTSNYKGSGKTFVSVNVAIALALANKRVLLIDGDLRHASASRLFKCTGKGLKGFADYLGEMENDVETLLTTHPQYATFDIMPVGTMPPNPTELLTSDRLPLLLKELRPQYDFILIDCPPTETLADASIIERYADRTLYVIRAGLFERKRLPDLEADVKNGKYKHLSVILNATKAGGRYGYHYGYKYGYHYHSYHYGYHYKG